MSFKGKSGEYTRICKLCCSQMISEVPKKFPQMMSSCNVPKITQINQICSVWYDLLRPMCMCVHSWAYVFAAEGLENARQALYHGDTSPDHPLKTSIPPTTRITNTIFICMLVRDPDCPTHYLLLSQGQYSHSASTLSTLWHVALHLEWISQFVNRLGRGNID